jgi:hypothetical protein
MQIKKLIIRITSFWFFSGFLQAQNEELPMEQQFMELYFTKDYKKKLKFFRMDGRFCQRVTIPTYLFFLPENQTGQQWLYVPEDIPPVYKW